MDDEDLAKLMQKILTKEGGIRVVIEILNMRWYRGRGKAVTYPQKLIVISREVLLQYDYGKALNRKDNPDYELAQIAGVALHGEEGAKSAIKLCQHLVKTFQESQIPYPQLLAILVHVQPYIFLDAFVAANQYMLRWMKDVTLGTPVNQIPEKVIIDWCELEAETRYPMIMPFMQTYSKANDSEELCWNPILVR